MRSDAPLLVTEALLRAAAGLCSPNRPPVALDEPTWLETIRLASAHLVLPALASGLDAKGPEWVIPEDARHYLQAMRDANAERNRRLKASLAATIDSLQTAGIDPLVVKGGAFLLTDTNAAPWRFAGDLDLIVPAGQLGRAVEVLADLGFEADGGGYIPARDAHAPAMLGQDGLTIVELHSRPFAAGHCPELEAALWWDRRGVRAGGIEIGIPSPEVRVAYLLLHSQEHHAYYAQGRLLIRDILDLAMLANDSGGIDWRATLEHCPAASRQRAGALLAAAHEFGIHMPGIIFDPPQRAWSGRVRARLARPVFHRQLTAALDMARYEAGRLFADRRRTLRLAKSIAEPGMLSRKVLRKLSEFRDRTAG